MKSFNRNIWIIFVTISLLVCSCVEGTNSDGDEDTADSEQTETDGDKVTDGDLELADTEEDADSDENIIIEDGDEESGCLVPDGDEDLLEKDLAEDSDISDGDTELSEEMENELVELEDETQIEQEVENDSELDTEAEIEPEMESESEEDTQKCPLDMVLAKKENGTEFCIDRYEASRVDADGNSAGSDESMAKSVYGVRPWYVNPVIRYDNEDGKTPTLEVFKAACTAAGKRICKADEWQGACKGPDFYSYTYGASFNKETCNSVATFCDDYCTDHGISMEDCNLNILNCGYHCGDVNGTQVQCMKILPTGQMPGCTNVYGHFDINGNVWEMVESPTDYRGFEIRGGAFNCAYPVDRVSCNYNAGWDALYAGFRCCKDIAAE